MTEESKEIRRVEILANTLARANTHFFFFTQLKDAWENDYEDEIRKSATFWDYTISGHLHIALVQLCRLYDKGCDSLHLYRFLQRDVERREVDVLDLPQLHKDRQFCGPDSTDLMVVKLRKWRNKIIAHCDHSVALSKARKFQTQYPFDRKEIQILIDKGFALLERWMLPEKWTGLDGKKNTTTRCLPRYADGKERYAFVLESLRFRLQHREHSAVR